MIWGPNNNNRSGSSWGTNNNNRSGSSWGSNNNNRSGSSWGSNNNNRSGSSWGSSNNNNSGFSGAGFIMVNHNNINHNNINHNNINHNNINHNNNNHNNDAYNAAPFFANQPEENIPNKFLIQVKNKKYTCNKLAVNSSEVIREFCEKNPEVNEYVYTFDGPVDNFSVICDFFNFKKITISKQNIKSLKAISENLKIDLILSQINTFLSQINENCEEDDKNDKSDEDDKKIDKYNEFFEKVNPVKEAFDLLYHIKELTVESVKNSLIESPWSHSEEKVKELASFIFQVASSSIELQPFLIDLIVSLDESSQNNIFLSILKPFIAKRILNFFYRSQYYCCFANKLVLKGIISIDQIIRKIVIYDDFINGNNTNNNNCINQKYHKNIVTWFLPELYENNLLKNYWQSHFSPKEIETFNNYKNGKIGIYKQMRDSGQPSNEILRAIFNDDVEALTTIIHKNNVDVNSYIDEELFDANEADRRSILDCSAQYCAVECFKNLLLNHAKCNQFTMSFAILGGNIEIIRIIEQQISQDHLNVNFYNNSNDTSQDNSNANFNNNNNNRSGGTWISLGNSPNNSNNNNDYLYDKGEILHQSNLSSPINFAIIMHKNDIFDWIIDNKIRKEDVNSSFLSNIAKVSVKSGNLHTFRYCIENRFSIQNNSDLVSISAANGYFSFIELILDISEKKIINFSSEFINKSSTFFGNIHISKLIFSNFSITYQTALLIAIKYDYEDIVQYILNDLYHNQGKNEINQLLEQSIINRSSAIFNIIINKFKLEDLIYKFGFQNNDFISLCKQSCSTGNLEISCKLIDFICEKFKSENLEGIIISCKSELFKLYSYLIDKKSDDITEMTKIYHQMSTINMPTALKLLERFDPYTKESLSKLLFDNSIVSKNNKNVFEMFLPYNLDNPLILFGAVNFRDINLVNQVLEHNSNPSFINQSWSNGTALCIAVENQDVKIVERLLSLPGIDTSLSNRNGYTPLILAIKLLNIELLSIFIDYFGERIQEQSPQLQQSLNILKNTYLDSLNNISQETAQKLVFVINGLSQVCPSLSVGNVDFLESACNKNKVNIVTELLNIKNINVNFQNNQSGETPLISAISENRKDIAHLLISSPTIDVNIRRYDMHTALTLATLNGMNETILKLISHPTFDPSKSNVNLAFFIAKNDQIMDYLYSVKDLNVNYQITSLSLLTNLQKINNERGYFSLLDTSLMHAAKAKQQHKIALILKHLSFDPSKSRIKDALIKSIISEDANVFNELFNFFKDANVILIKGKSIFDFLVEQKWYMILKKILNESQVNLSKEKLLKYYHKYMIGGQNDMLYYLIEYDKKHNHYIDTNDISAMEELIQILQ